MGFNLPSSGAKAQAQPTINVTPLVDVVLVLLIIFMVVAPLLNKQFWVNLPKKDETKQENPPPDAEKPLVLNVDKAGVIKVNTTVVESSELRVRLERMLAARSDKIVYFDAADDAPYQTVVSTMDLARQGGASTIAIMTPQKR
jgi:biopolymer transport protein ExbD/biopolymer transport protein TolR